jgi:opacity protein-like surface antigen
MIVYDTRRSRGLRRVSFGLVGNITRDYNYRVRASGTNDETTLAGSLASQADGYPESTLQGGSYQSDMPSWETMVGYKAGLFDPIPGREGGYIGLTERLRSDGEVALADRIGQYYGNRRYGSKYDLLMNFGLDFSDRFYVGANIGITSLDYRSDETRAEEGIAGITYPSGFESLQMRNSLRDEGTGIYAKLGIIARPAAGLRIGAAIQTPTLMRIREDYQLEGRSVADGVTWTKSSPQDEWFYNFRTPLRFNAGVAYTIGKVGLVSADYEYFDYNKMRFVSDYDYDIDFSGVNADIQDFTRATHAFRIGGELKPIPQMALRVGYNYTTSPDVDVKKGRQSVSFGIGYSSAGSFFLDAAVRFQYLPDEFITPYKYYGWDEAGTFVADVATPEICAQASLCNALLTLGWRF